VTAVPAARRRLLADSLGIAVAVAAFGFIFGLAAREAGLSALETSAMSVVVFAGASQFAAVGYLAAGLPWPAIVLLTFLLNARHLLYSASLAPRLRRVPLGRRAAMAHVLTDEAFALSAAHFQRLGRIDLPGYWMAALVGVFIPWNVATLAGALLGGAIPDPYGLGLDIVFPAAMAGLALGLVTGRRDLVAAGAGAVSGITLSLALGPSLGIVAGGLLGPALAMLVPERRTPAQPDSDIAGVPVDVDEAALEMGHLDTAAPGPAAAAPGPAAAVPAAAIPAAAGGGRNRRRSPPSIDRASGPRP
jgi:4-azaleucine resistance transporter AzlC